MGIFLQLFDFWCFYWHWLSFNCLNELLTADGIFHKTRNQKGIATGGNKVESSLPCSASLLLLTRSHHGSMAKCGHEDSVLCLSSHGLVKHSALLEHLQLKEPGCFLNNTSMALQQEQSVALHPLHNLTAHTTLPWTGQHSAASSQNLWQNYLIYIRYHLKLHLKLRSSEFLDMLRSWLCPLLTLEVWLISCKLNHNTSICSLSKSKEKSFCLKKAQRSLQCMFISI